MSDRQINCTACSTNLGTIRDARLRKDISYSCNKCLDASRDKIRELERQIRAMKSARAAEKMGKPPTDDRFADLFDDLFGGK